MSNAAKTRLGRRAAIRQTLAGAVAQGIACMALAGPLAVASGWTNAASQSAQAFDIAAGPLASALNQFGQSAHILLSYPAQLVEGKNSPGLQGQHAIDSGLAVLLSGTGLQAVREANGNYSLVVAAVPGALQLGEVSISGKAPGSTTEGTGLYSTYSSSSSTRLNLTPRETPQSLTVMSAKFSRNATISYLQGVESIHDQHKPTAASLFRGVPAG